MIYKHISPIGSLLFHSSDSALCRAKVVKLDGSIYQKYIIFMSQVFGMSENSNSLYSPRLRRFSSKIFLVLHYIFRCISNSELIFV